MSWIHNICNSVRNTFVSIVNVIRCKSNQFADNESLNLHEVPDATTVFHFYEPLLTEIDKSIECESYFRAIDRSTAEDLLQDRIDGSCLVRPFKEQDATVKYIVSIYAKENFFHLFIRYSNGMYAIGQQKPDEKHFRTPTDIINFYRLNKLLCSNKMVSFRFFLVPIN